MDERKEKILNKIKKLFALSKSDNIHESARAIEQVQKIMQIYNLENTDVENSYINSCLSKYKMSLKSLPLPMRSLLILMKDKFAVEVIVKYVDRNSDYKTNLYFEFFGFNENPEIASYTFDFLARNIKIY